MNQGDIYLVPFPFSDLSGTKVRPVLIVSHNAFNKSGKDILVCAITSVYATNAIRITQKHLDNGVLFADSYIKYESIFKLDTKLLLKKIGSVNTSIRKKIKAKIVSLF